MSKKLSRKRAYKNRLSAIALWATIPEKRFNIAMWVQETDCGTVCCALGWLAEKQHDGWAFNRGKLPTLQGKLASFRAAARYFGISREDARSIFGSQRSAYKVDKPKPTLMSVTSALLNAPYETKGKKHAD